MLFFCDKYPTRFIELCLAVALVVTTVSCGRQDADSIDSRELSEDEIYLIDAYLEIKHARGYYPNNPAVADSFFAVLDSTIDSDRIANIIRIVNQEPDRWAVIFEAIEQKFRDLEKQQKRKTSPGATPERATDPSGSK